ncbi:MAG: glycosyltransferase family 2 protein [Chitinophagaceae bacterium]|nr:glycosyltransferase family 2 protein [Chitinophagaceae bacterium]
MNKKVCVIIPAFNEEGNIKTIVTAIKEVFDKLPYDYYFLFIDDGSTDNTLSTIEALSKQNDHIKYISFSKNNGHQAALKAGIDHSQADCAISLDGDMQHPPALIAAMLVKWEEGFEVVYTIRKDEKRLPFFKRISSSLFYKLLGKLSSIELENGSADFRLMDKKVTTQLKLIKENDIFLRGLVKWMGFRQTSIAYQPAERYSGKSKYSYKKMMLLALQGITSFSTKPLYIAIYIGFTFSLLSLLYIPYAIYSYFIGKVVSGWASLIVTVTFLGGLQLIILGIIGLYLGKLFMQSKGRPMYIIDKTNIT